MKLGDAISSVATPIARTLGLPCIDPVTNQLRPESGCAKRRDSLNDFSSRVFDYFFEQRTKGEKVKYILQVEVEAEDLTEALGKKNEGKVIAGNPRPTPPVGTGMVKPSSPLSIHSSSLKP